MITSIAWGDALLSLAVGLGLAAAVGLRVFLPMFVLGAAARAGMLPLAPGFEWMASTEGLLVLGTATAVEVGAYFVPLIDNLLDVLAGPAAVVAGVLAVAAVVTELPPTLRWPVAIIAGGATAGAMQGVTSVLRLKSAATTGGLANPLVAALELAGSLGLATVAVLMPLLAVALAAILLALLARAFRRRQRRASSSSHRA